MVDIHVDILFELPGYTHVVSSPTEELLQVLIFKCAIFILTSVVPLYMPLLYVLFSYVPFWVMPSTRYVNVKKKKFKFINA